MRQTRDTFLHFLADNISSVPVHNVRTDSDNPEDIRYQMNSINVTFLDTSPSPQIGTTLVEICIAADKELDALTWVKSVYDVLSSAYMTPKMDYTNPASPVKTGTMVYWDSTIRFRSVKNPDHAFYYDYRCVMTLYHKVDS